MFRYYLTQRPPMPGTFPRLAKNVVSYEDRIEIPNLTSRVWGYVEYEAPLKLKQIREYELREAGPFYVNRETGEMLSRQMMLEQYRTEYNGDDPTNCIGWDEYFEEV